jgi:hypothetical protein
MVTGVQLADGSRAVCSQRVCRDCHNPLPADYGLYKVKFISIIGVMGAGKTVFLSQFLKGFQDYAVRGGLTALRRTTAIHQFITDNRIAEETPLPTPTRPGRFEQPLIYNIEKRVAGRRELTTIVMYDIAGEVFKNENMTNVGKFAPFIQHSDGIMLLVDPEQFVSIAQARRVTKEIQRPSEALDNIRSQIMSRQDLCAIPIGVCISKMDSIVDFLDSYLLNYIQSDYNGEQDPGSSWGQYRQVFNMRDHMVDNRHLAQFVAGHDMPLMSTLDSGFSNYQFFGFTALNCDVQDGCPVGPIRPHRIEEPILWMFNQMGIIGTNAIICPRCQNSNVVQFDTRLQEIERRERGLFGREKVIKEQIPVNCRCNVCGYAWFQQRT